MGVRVIFLFMVLLGFLFVYKVEQLSCFGIKIVYYFNVFVVFLLKILVNCYLVYFNMIVCYGLRYFSDGDREDIDEFLGKLNKIYNESVLFCY